MDGLHSLLVEGTEPATKATASRRVLKIVSKCNSEADFLAVFHRFCDHESLFVVTRTPKPVGSNSRLAITLADGKPMIVGEGHVIESSLDAKNALGRPGMRIRFTELDRDSRATLAKLNETRATEAARTGARGAAEKPGRATLMTPAVPPPTAIGTPPPTALGGAPIKIPDIPHLKSTLLPRSETERKPMRGGSERLASPRVLAKPAKEPSPELDSPLPPPPSKERNGVPLKPVLLARSGPVPLGKTSSGGSGGSQADDDAPTNVSGDVPGKARAPSELTAVDNPLGEMRAEGSDFILPANPFGQVTDQSLEAFVECTLYEETGSILIEPEGEAREDDSLPPWWPKAGDGTLTPLPPAAPGMFAPGMDNTGEVPLGRAPTPPSFGPGHAPAPGTAPTAMMQGAPAVAGALVPAFPSFRQPTAWLPIAVTALATAVITLVLGYVLWGTGGNEASDAPKPGAALLAARAVAPEPAAEVPAPAVPAAVAPAAAVPDGESESETETANEGEGEGETVPPAEEEVLPDPPGDEEPEAREMGIEVGATECKVSVTTEPEGSRVYANGRALPGKTPLVANVPCTTTVLDIKRSRYEDVRRPVAPTAGEVAQVAVRLQRPKVQLRLVSYPAGATVSIRGRRIGTAPLTTTVDGFLYTTITFEKSGYKKAFQRIYPKDKLTLVKGRLGRSGTARRR